MYNNEVGFYLNFKKQVKKAIKKSRNESKKKPIQQIKHCIIPMFEVLIPKLARNIIYYFIKYLYTFDTLDSIKGVNKNLKF